MEQSSKIDGVKKVKCPNCYRLLCKRVPVHTDQVDTFVLEAKHKGITIYSADITIGCPSCSFMHRVTGEEGIIETIGK